MTEWEQDYKWIVIGLRDMKDGQTKIVYVTEKREYNGRYYIRWADVEENAKAFKDGNAAEKWIENYRRAMENYEVKNTLPTEVVKKNQTFRKTLSVCAVRNPNVDTYWM